MKKISNWKTVFGFTLNQILKRKGFIISTLLGAVLIFMLVAVICVAVAAPDDEEAKSDIKKVFVLDESGYMPTDYAAYIQVMQVAEYSEIEFEYLEAGESEEALLNRVDAETGTIVLRISTEAQTMEALVADGSDISESTALFFVEDMLQYFEMNKLAQAGLTEEQLAQAMAPVVTSVYELDEDENFVAYMIRIFVPMLFGLLLYFMLLFHGQTICTEVSSEKTSKLMESLLTYCHPYALIAGKILAVTMLAVCQVVIWALAAVGGLVGGGLLAGAIFEIEAAPVGEIVTFLEENISATVFSVPGTIMALIIFFVGLLFYNVLAGVAGSMVARPEDASSTQIVYQFPVIISFILSYFAFFMDNNAVLSVIRYVPFTSPFCIPVELIMGSVSILEGFISMLILLVFSLLIIAFSAIIYKGLVLYNGEKVSPRTIVNILRNKSKK